MVSSGGLGHEQEKQQASSGWQHQVPLAGAKNLPGYLLGIVESCFTLVQSKQSSDLNSGCGEYATPLLDCLAFGFEGIVLVRDKRTRFILARWWNFIGPET